MNNKKSLPPKGWASVKTIADLLAISEQGVRQVYIPQLAAEHIDRESKPILLKFSAVIEILAQRRAEEIIGETTADPLLGDGEDSPALERYRLARAKLAELDLEHRKGELIDVTTAKAILARWANIIRRTGERLNRKYPPDVSEIFNHALDECRVAVAEICEPTNKP